MESRRLWHSNIKVLFFWMFFIVNFFTPKLMKIKWSFLYLGSFTPHFQIKLSTHGSNLNSIFAIMSELNSFCWWGSLLKTSTCGPSKISWKKSKTSRLDHSGHIEGDIMQNHEQKQKVKRSKTPRFYGQNKKKS
jgi:hypothetical protein